MTKQEIFQKARIIQLHTQKILGGMISGDYRTTQKGVGFEFEQLADYQYGSDIRFIDWKSSARMNKMLIKEFKQERSRTIFVIVDVSASNQFSSTAHTKQNIINEIAAIIAMAGIYTRDLVSVILVSDHIELYIPPARGISHGYRLVESLFSTTAKGTTTALRVAFEFVRHVQKEKSCIFVISDFIDNTFEHELPLLLKRNELIAIRVLDKCEQKIPLPAFIHMHDLETNDDIVVDTGTAMLQSWLTERLFVQTELFKKYRIDCFSAATDKLAIDDLLLFFKKRAFRL